jgi:hypothetical protein
MLFVVESHAEHTIHCVDKMQYFLMLKQLVPTVTVCFEDLI